MNIQIYEYVCPVHPVVWLDGISGWYVLDRVGVLEESEEFEG